MVSTSPRLVGGRGRAGCRPPPPGLASRSPGPGQAGGCRSAQDCSHMFFQSGMPYTGSLSHVHDLGAARHGVCSVAGDDDRVPLRPGSPCRGRSRRPAASSIGSLWMASICGVGLVEGGVVRTEHAGLVDIGARGTPAGTRIHRTASQSTSRHRAGCRASRGSAGPGWRSSRRCWRTAAGRSRHPCTPAYQDVLHGDRVRVVAQVRELQLVAEVAGLLQQCLGLGCVGLAGLR